MTLEQITRTACTYYNQDYKVVLSGTRKKEVVKVRHLCILAAVAAYEYNYSQVASHVGTDHSTVRKAYLNQLHFVEIYGDHFTEVNLFLKNFKKMTTTYPIKVIKQIPEVFEFKLSASEMATFHAALNECINDIDHDVTSIDLYVLEEIKKSVLTRLEKKQLKYTIKLIRSQTATIYKWFNEVDFKHPLSTSLAIKLVGIIHKQITSL